MRVIVIILVLVLAGASLNAQQSMDQLRARMESSKGGAKAKFAMEIAARQVEEANAAFEAGQTDRGHQLVREATDLVQQAGNDALEANKKVKDTEISVRKLGKRLEGIQRTVNFDDQDQFDESLQIINTVRNKLLDRMFSLDKDDKKTKRDKKK